MTHPRGKRFKPSSRRGGWVTLGLAVFFLALGGWGLVNLPGRPIAGQTFWLAMAVLVSFGAGLFFLYRAYTLFKLIYYIDRNGLEIRWGSMTRRIPIAGIAAIKPAETGLLPVQQLFGVPLPAWWPGRWGNVVFRTTASPQGSMAVQTKEETFIISPRNPTELIRAWQLRLPLGPTQHWQQEIIRHSVWAHPVWRDLPALRLAGGAMLLCLILIGSVMIGYPTWPAAIPIRFDALGQAAGIASRRQLLWIPMGGVIILAFNLVLGLLWYKKDRVAAYLLWFVAILVQIGLWVGVRMIVG